MSPEVEAVGTPSSLAVLLGAVIDYAGTFPPARLDLPDATARYGSYRKGADAWMLHRFVLPATELDVFEREAKKLAREDDRWRISVVCGGPEARDLASRWTSRFAVVDSLEVRHCVPPDGAQREVFVERSLPCERDSLRELRDRGALLKIRLGGERAESTPPSSQLAEALTLCAALGLSLKATAGLHRALRSDSHGFLNLLLAATLAHHGGSTSEVESLLEETDPHTFVFEEDSVSWSRHRLSLETIAKARRWFRSFGSCSFEEPLESLAELGLLEP
jgi:hypothetical protein